MVRLISVGLGLGVWEWYGDANPRTFASLSTVMRSLVHLWGTGSFWSAFATSVLSFLIGFAASSVIGPTLGIVMAQFRPVGRIAGVYLRIILSVPLVGVVPLIVVALGVGTVPQVLIVFLFSFAEITLNSYAGVRYADGQLVEMAQTLLAPKATIFRKILLPGALPGIMVGLRIGVGHAVIGMVVAELLLTSVGIGSLVTQFEQTYALADLLATVLTLLLFGALVTSLVQRVERLVDSRRRT